MKTYDGSAYSVEATAGTDVVFFKKGCTIILVVY